MLGSKSSKKEYIAVGARGIETNKERGEKRRGEREREREARRGEEEKYKQDAIHTHTHTQKENPSFSRDTQIYHLSQ